MVSKKTNEKLKKLSLTLETLSLKTELYGKKHQLLSLILSTIYHVRREDTRQFNITIKRLEKFIIT